MAEYRFRGALNAASFPLVSTMQSRTVIQPQLDNNVKTTQAFYGTAESADYSIPQIMYCENVVPTAEGLQSVGYAQIIEALPAAADFDQAITLRDADENNFLFSPAAGMNYIYRAVVGAWVSTNPIVAANKAVTRAYVNGRTFICYATLGVYEYDSALNTFNKLTLIGITDAEVEGISASNNYMIMFSGITVYWSSLINPLDIVPSLTTGAGFAIPQDVKARITAIIGTAGGFIIYTAKNAVAAVYTQNIRAPFSFKEISNAGGITSYEQVTSDQNAGPQYAWTTGGLQKITTQGAEAVSAEVNDFIAGRIWESWDVSSKSLTVHRETSSEFPVKLTYIASRYLVISYSTSGSALYDYALVFDTILKRWGKLKLEHVDCFSYPYPNVFGDLSYDDLALFGYDELGDVGYAGLETGVESDPPSKKTLAFLKPDGQVELALLDYNKEVTQQGVVIFGKFQLTRARMMGLQSLDLENVVVLEDSAPDTTVHALLSLDGRNLDQAYPMQLIKQATGSQRWAKRLTGLNVGIAVEGTFALSSYLLTTTNEGTR